MTKNLTFLLADDDPDDAFMFEKILKEVDPSVKFLLAKDGREALDVLAGAEQLPNIVFLDLNMPKIDGKECLLFIKNDDRLRDLPVIMYTTSSLSKDIEDCMMHGAACL